MRKHKVPPGRKIRGVIKRALNRVPAHRSFAPAGLHSDTMIDPTDESVGYDRTSLRDKDRFIGWL